MNMKSFADEFMKLANDKITMSAFTDEVVKLSTVAKAVELAKVHKGLLKNVGVGGGAIGAYLTGKQAKDDYMLGRRMRKQYERQQRG